MTVSDADRLRLRGAFEALRAGVPNRAAIAALGSVEDALETRFEWLLAQAWAQEGSKRRDAGLLFAGGFGTGKSHLLGFLRELALRDNFVVSTVAISKETPLSAPAVLYQAALRDAVAPGCADDAIGAALAGLQRRHDAREHLAGLSGAPDAGLDPMFKAILHLLGRPIAPDLLRRIEGFLAGGKLPAPVLRRALADAGATAMLPRGGAGEAELVTQRVRFMPMLFRAAGFAGWCLLLDEIELIGRYTPLQRGRAYAELAAWLGLAADPAPGLVVAGAITDDYASQVIEARQDAEKLPDRLRLKGVAAQATLATAAMRAIQTAPVLRPPDAALLARHAETLRRGYEAAYGWAAPSLPVGERRTNRTMRHHIRGWITQWDMLRVQGMSTALDVDTLASNYAESGELDSG